MFVVIDKKLADFEDNDNKIQTFYWEQTILGYGYKKEETLLIQKKHTQ